MEKHALVVGGAGGVGSAVVKQLVDRGYRVFTTVLNEDQRQGLIAKIPGIGAIGIVDLTNADQVSSGLASLLGPAPRLDVAAVCTGVAFYGPVETTPLSVLRQSLEINMIAGVAVYQAIMPYLRQSKGRMLLMSSMAGRVAFPFLGYYSASKFALEAATDVMRREAANWDVDIILAQPGGIKTSMVTNQQKSIVDDKATLTDEVRALYGNFYDAYEAVVKNGYETSTPPEDVASVIVNALTAVETPKARYAIGPDSVYLCSIARTMSDEELDKVARLESANDKRT